MLTVEKGADLAPANVRECASDPRLQTPGSAALRRFVSVLMFALLAQSAIESIATAALGAHAISLVTRGAITTCTAALFYFSGLYLMCRLIDRRVTRRILLAAIGFELFQKSIETFLASTRFLLSEPTILALKIVEAVSTRVPVILLALALILILVELEDSRRGLQEQKRKLRAEMEERKRVDAERAQLAARVYTLEKERSLGFLAAGVAHDFNNLLAIVSGYADLIAQGVDPDSPIQPRLRTIVKAVRRGKELSTRMLAYAGDLTLNRREIDLRDLVTAMHEELRANVPAGVEFIIQDPGRPVFLKGDEQAIKGLIHALFENAVEATKYGTIVVSVALGDACQVKGRSLCFGNVLTAGETAIVRIADTGCGMDKHTLTHAFDPFFSTKFLGRGLGLPAALGIVRAHGGCISVLTMPGQGSTFEAQMPVVLSQVVSAPQSSENCADTYGIHEARDRGDAPVPFASCARRSS